MSDEEPAAGTAATAEPYGILRGVSTGVLSRRQSTRRRAQPVLGLGLALVVVQLAFRAWAVWGSWFQFDDVAFITRVLHQPWSWSLVAQGYGGHLMPGGLTLTWLFTRIDPLGFHAYAATLVALQALADLGFLVLLISLFGRRLGVLVPLSLYLFSALTFPAFVWWAAGVNQLFLQIALAWGLLAHLRYLRTGRFRWIVVTALVVVGCLLFYEKVLLTYVAIAWLTLAYFLPGSLWQRLTALFTRHWRALGVHGALVAAYLVWYLTAARGTAGAGAGADGLLPLAGNVAGKAWLPGVVGGPLRWEVLTGPFQLVDTPTPVLPVALLVVSLVVGAIARTYRRSWRAWILPAAFVLIDIGLLQSARAGAVGPVSGLELRYITELGLVTPLALAAACLPVVGAPEQVEPRGVHRFLDDRELVALATALVCVLGVYSTFRYAEHWRGSTQSREFFANADRSLGSERDPSLLANVSVPQYLMWGYDYPHNTTRYVLGMFDHRMTFPDTSVDHLNVISDDGTVVPAQITPLITTSRPREGRCLARVTSSGSVDLPLTGPVHGTGAWARMSYARPPSHGPPGDHRRTDPHRPARTRLPQRVSSR